MKWIVCYGLCPALALLIIWFRQGRYLADIQIMPAIAMGPVTLLMALVLPRSCWTSREEQEGTKR